MPSYNISKSFGRTGQISERSSKVMRMFGLTRERLAEGGCAVNCQLEINEGDIVYITGPSGAGKSVLLRELEKAIPSAERVNLNKITLPADRAVIDCIDGDFVDGLKTLSIAGLNDAFCVLNQPINLSDGQKYRFRLAVALASGAKYIFADEYCSELDRVTAAVISYNIHKYAKRTGATFILASSHDDVLKDLAPDVLVVKELSGATRVVYKSVGA